MVRKESAKTRRKRQKADDRDEKHGDAHWQEPAPEEYAKWKARELEEAAGKDARRKAHDAKRGKPGDRTKEQIDEDYQSSK